MNTIQQDYKFKSIYQFVDIIYKMVENDFNFWNFNPESFVQSALKFNRCSLLHIYVSSTLYCFYSREFLKDGDLIEDDDIKWWIELFIDYGVKLRKRKCDYDEDNASWNWFKRNKDSFIEFFDVISDEIVHILFNNKQFLIKFNRLVRNVLIDKDNSYCDFVFWPSGARNNNGTIKRCNVPQWVKQAVYHRDKGRCVFCNKDLTGIVNTLSQKNFDHIIPLNDYGTNDPCNIQLTCEDCNKGKGGRDIVPVYKYQKWW